VEKGDAPYGECTRGVKWPHFAAGAADVLYRFLLANVIHMDRVLFASGNFCRDVLQHREREREREGGREETATPRCRSQRSIKRGEAPAPLRYGSQYFRGSLISAADRQRESERNRGKEEGEDGSRTLSRRVRGT